MFSKREAEMAADEIIMRARCAFCMRAMEQPVDQFITSVEQSREIAKRTKVKTLILQCDDCTAKKTAA